jgi:hypothetical protein
MKCLLGELNDSRVEVSNGAVLFPSWSVPVDR